MRVYILSLVLFIILLSSSVYAAQIFSDDFESGNLDGWTLTTLGTANDWTASTTNPDQGSYHAQSWPRYTTQPASVMQRTISTSGYQNIIFNYSRRLVGLDAADEFQVEWFDGTDWTILEQTGSSSANDASYLSRQYSLPSSADNNPNFAIKFECTAGATSEYCRVDNVNITGTVISDTTAPNINIIYPINNSNFSIKSVNVNYTVLDNIALSSCGYSNDTFSVNITLPNCQNITTVNWAEGQHNVTIWVNDSSNNINSSSVTFFIDSIYPLINYGEGTENNGVNVSRNWIYVNVTLVEENFKNITFLLVNDTGTVNRTTYITQIFFINWTNLQDGIYYYNVTIYDILNNVNSTETRQITLDTTPPYFTIIPAETIITYGQGFEVDFDAVDDIAFGSFSINWTTHFNINQSGYLRNITKLASGIYYINVTINDTTGNKNSTIYQVTVNKATASLSLSAVPSWNENYATSATVTGNGCPAELTCNLYRENSLVNNPDIATLGAGSYNYIYNTTGNQNYTSATVSNILTINKANPNVKLYLNGNRDNLTVSYGTQTNASAYSDISGVILYRNGVDVTSENSQLIIFGAGYYNYTAHHPGNENYSSGTETWFLNVTKASQTAVLSFNPSSPITYGTFVNVTCNGELFRDDINVTNEIANNILLGAGTWQYSCKLYESQNYSYDDGNSSFVVNKASPTANMQITGTTPITYGTLSDFSGIETNSGDEDCSYSLNPSNAIYGAGTWQFNYSTSGCENYTAGSITRDLVVNQASNSINLLLNNQANNLTLVYLQQINASASSSIGIISLYRNNVNIDNENSQNITLANGFYEYFANSTGNQNYSFNSTGLKFYLNITKASSEIYLYLNHSRDNITIENGTSIWLNATLQIGEGIIKLYKDGNLINQGIAVSNYTLFDSVGLYNITAIYQETQNYTSSSESFWVNVTLADILPPYIAFISPLNTTYTTEQILINISFSDAQSVWWYNGTENLTYISEILYNFSEGSHTIIVYANDSIGNINSSSVSFFVDSISPSLTVYSPESKIYNISQILINFSSDSYQSLWYFNSTANKTYTTPEIITLQDGTYNFIFYAQDTVGNLNFTSVGFEVNTTIPKEINLKINCESAGNYQKNALVLVQGNVTNNGIGLNLQEVNASVYRYNYLAGYNLNNSKLLTTDNDGSFETSFSDLKVGSYVLNAITFYQGVNASCIDIFEIGSQASFVLDKLATIQNISNETIIYNITLRLINKGGSDAINTNISDIDSLNSPYYLGAVLSNSTEEINYLKEFLRQDKETYFLLSGAIVYGIDEFSDLMISANSSAVNISIPGTIIGKKITITKNVAFIIETSRNVTYNVSSTLYNTGDENLTDIIFIDTDISGVAINLNLEKGNYREFSNLVIISKAATNTEHEFALGTATIDSFVFYSNRPKINIPGYGGPADIFVFAPASVSASTTFDTIIEIINKNSDIGQDFVIDYWLTNNAESVNYSSGQKTIYVSALSSTNTTISFTAPSSDGIYKIKALTRWIDGEASAFDSFEVTVTEEEGEEEEEIQINETIQQNKTIEEEKEEIICNKPYIRYGSDCCLDVNDNSICDFDEKPEEKANETKKRGFLTGLFITEPGEEEISITIRIILWIILIILIVLFILWKILKKRKKPKDVKRLRNLIAKKVYAENGERIGKVKEAMLQEHRIESLKIKLVKNKIKDKTKAKGIIIKYVHVKAVADIVIVDKNVLKETKLEKTEKASSVKEAGVEKVEMLISNENVLKEDNIKVNKEQVEEKKEVKEEK